MREIKFRGKSVVSDEWLYGDLVQLKDGDKTITCIYRKGEVDPDTVGQYTGMHDVDGTEIYEGDTVRVGCFNYIVTFTTEDVGSCGCCVPSFDGTGFVLENNYKRATGCVASFGKVVGSKEAAEKTLEELKK